MPELTTGQVAERLRVTVARVFQLARARGVKPARFGKSCVWTEADVVGLKPRKGPGAPRKDERGD